MIFFASLLDRTVHGKTDEIIDWQEARYLASNAPVRLEVSYDRLSEINPVDLGRIVEALSFRESAEIVAALDDETVAETLEVVSDERVADLQEGMDKERAADILEEMAPGVVVRRRPRGLLEVNRTTTISKLFFYQFAEQILDLGFGIGQRHATSLGDLIHPPIPSTGALMP
jgi:hypothetical protein